MTAHQIRQCRHGTVVARCRCPGPHQIVEVPCPDWCVFGRPPSGPRYVLPHTIDGVAVVPGTVLVSDQTDPTLNGVYTLAAVQPAPWPWDRDPSARRCDVAVGHVDDQAAWIDVTSGMMVCDRHRRQYDERPDLGPFNWAKLS